MAFTPQQIAAALRSAGFNRGPSAQDTANANRYGLGIFGQTANRIQRPMGAPGVQPPSGADAITQSFIEQVKSLFTPGVKSNVKPFDQSGFFDPKDAQALATREFAPHFQDMRLQQTQQQGIQDKNNLEAVNAAGGLNSSAYRDSRVQSNDAF